MAVDSTRQLEKLQKQIIACTRCPRLVRHCRRVAKERRRMYRDWNTGESRFRASAIPTRNCLSWALRRPLTAATAREGCLPATARGLLYRGLYEAGLANQLTSVSRDDGLELRNCYITASLRCAPPKNKPLPREARIASPTSKRNCGCSRRFAPSSSWVGSRLRLMCGWWRRSTRIFRAARHSICPRREFLVAGRLAATLLLLPSQPAEYPNRTPHVGDVSEGACRHPRVPQSISIPPLTSMVSPVI